MLWVFSEMVNSVGAEALQISTHNMFYGEIRKFIREYHQIFLNKPSENMQNFTGNACEVQAI